MMISQWLEISHAMHATVMMLVPGAKCLCFTLCYDQSFISEEQLAILDSQTLKSRFNVVSDQHSNSLRHKTHPVHLGRAEICEVRVGKASTCSMQLSLLVAVIALRELILLHLVLQSVFLLVILSFQSN